MKVNLLKKGEKLTDFGWGIARKKPIEIHYREVIPNDYDCDDREMPMERVHTHEGVLWAYPDRDFIICGIESELYPIKKNIFYKSYDVIEKPQSLHRKANTKGAIQ